MRNRWGTFVVIGVCALLALGAIVAVASGGRDDGETRADFSSGGSASESVAVAPSSTAPTANRELSGAATDAKGAATAGLGGLPTPELRAHVVRRATLELEVGRKQGDETLRKVIDAVGLVGGFVESTDQSGGRARLTVRVPAGEFDATLDRLHGFGRERGLEVHGQDVTGAVTDIDARLRNLRAQEAVLLDLMRKAGSIGDSIAVQQQLSQNQEQIEQLAGQQRALADQTTYATLVVSITPKGAPAVGSESESTLGEAWSNAVDAALAVIGGTLVVLGALLPIALLAGVAALVWRLVLRVRRPRESTGPVPAAG